MTARCFIFFDCTCISGYTLLFSVHVSLFGVVKHVKWSEAERRKGTRGS